MSTFYSKLILLCALSGLLLNHLPAYCEVSDPWDQFSSIPISDHDRIIIEQQTGKLRYVSVWHDSGLLKKFRILRISIPGTSLERMILPAGGSIGIFAFDGKQLFYLNGAEAKNNLSTIFKTENVFFEKTPPQLIASLFCATVLQHHNDGAIILSSSGDLQTYKGYTLDQAEFKKCEGQIKPPRIIGSKKTGWKVFFYTLHGIMHDKRSVCSYEIEISPKFDININEKVLSNKVFSSVPRIEY